LLLQLFPFPDITNLFSAEGDKEILLDRGAYGRVRSKWQHRHMIPDYGKPYKTMTFAEISPKFLNVQGLWERGNRVLSGSRFLKCVYLEII
jgi:hypothetical protein